MLKLRNELYKPLINILDDIPFNTWFVRSVLEGHADGQVYVDKEINPASIYVCHAYGMTFLYGECNNDVFNNQLMQYFRTIKKDEWLQAYPRDWDPFMIGLTSNDGVVLSSRLNFVFDRKKFEENTGHLNLDGYTVQEGTVDIMRNFKGKVVPKCYWKDLLIHKCKSYVAIADGMPVSIAFSSFLHGNNFELGMETLESHRGQGYALALCILLIRYCIKEGLTPVWACRLENIGSVKLANRLGFVETQRFPYYHVPVRKS